MAWTKASLDASSTKECYFGIPEAVCSLNFAIMSQQQFNIGSIYGKLILSTNIQAFISESE